MIVLQIEKGNIPLPDFEKEWEAVEHQYFSDGIDSEQIATALAIEINNVCKYKCCDFRARVFKWTEQEDGTFISKTLI